MTKIEDSFFDIEKILIEDGIVNEVELHMAKSHLRFSTDRSLTDIIVELKIADEVKILHTLKKINNRVKIISDDINLGSEENVKNIKNFHYNLKKNVSIGRKQVIFFLDEDNKKLKIATSDVVSHKNLKATSELLSGTLGYEVEYTGTPHMKIALMQKKMYDDSLNYEEEIYKMVLDPNILAEKTPEIVSKIIEYASMEFASDIFIQYNKKSSEYSYMFFKINSEKGFKFVFPTHTIMNKITSVIKNLSNMEAVKIKGHQDGSLVAKILDNKYSINVRTSSISTTAGEQLVLRVAQDGWDDIEKIGFEDEDVVHIQNVLSKGKGIILAVGPTGSGKTTTLHAMLNEFKTYQKNIITLEDPVEIQKFGVNQIEIDERAGQSFGESLRSVLRQAPDIVMIGEIRDEESALKAIEFSNTGHLVLASLHTKNATKGVLERLSELNITDNSLEAFKNTVRLSIYQVLLKDPDSPKQKLAYEITKSESSPLNGEVKKVGF